MGEKREASRINKKQNKAKQPNIHRKRGFLSPCFHRTAHCQAGGVTLPCPTMGFFCNNIEIHKEIW